MGTYHQNRGSSQLEKQEDPAKIVFHKQVSIEHPCPLPPFGAAPAAGVALIAVTATPQGICPL